MLHLFLFGKFWGGLHHPLPLGTRLILQFFERFFNDFSLLTSPRSPFRLLPPSAPPPPPPASRRAPAAPCWPGAPSGSPAPGGSGARSGRGAPPHGPASCKAKWKRLALYVGPIFFCASKNAIRETQSNLEKSFLKQFVTCGQHRKLTLQYR